MLFMSMSMLHSIFENKCCLSGVVCRFEGIVLTLAPTKTQLDSDSEKDWEEVVRFSVWNLRCYQGEKGSLRCMSNCD